MIYRDSSLLYLIQNLAQEFHLTTKVCMCVLHIEINGQDTDVLTAILYALSAFIRLKTVSFAALRFIHYFAALCLSTTSKTKTRNLVFCEGQNPACSFENGERKGL